MLYHYVAPFLIYNFFGLASELFTKMYASFGILKIYLHLFSLHAFENFIYDFDFNKSSITNQHLTMNREKKRKKFTNDDEDQKVPFMV
jgi:hypothetical protein